MKKGYKISIGVIIVFIILGIASYLFYNNLSASNAFKEGTEFIDEGKYDKALEKFNLALNYKLNYKKVLEEKEMIEEYLCSKKLFNEEKIKEANEEINKVNNNYKEINNFKDDVDKLKVEINHSIENMNNINKIKELINKQDFNNAKSLINNIEKESLSKNQKNQVKDLKVKVDSELNKIENEKRKIEEERKKQEEVKKEKEIKNEENINKQKNNNIHNKVIKNKENNESEKANSKDRAISLVKKLTSGYTNLDYNGMINIDNRIYHEVVASGEGYGRATYLVPVEKTNEVYVVVRGDGGKPDLYLASY
ncbi:hypothetical protein [Clostridium sp.]|uniref:hypothetical protein n=1 Tax=Clostridium sp. TaxID=1506 RepID=UPI0026DC0DAB|nr:hypothetical protein [Clostridium sp.]MDO5039242.1 hypothetical protein [Clostridium sp.]